MSEKLFWVDICLCLYHMTALFWVCTNALSMNSLQFTDVICDTETVSKVLSQ